MLTLLTYPEPIYTAAEAKALVPALAGGSDAQVESWLMAARIDAQFYIGRAIGEQTWRWQPWLHSYEAWGQVPSYGLAWACYPLTLKVPLPPLVSVDGITYLDQDGTEQTVDPAGYVVTGVGGQGYITLAAGSSWPSVGAYPYPVTILFTAGEWEPDGIIPEGIKQAILLKAASMQAAVDAGATGGGALKSRSIEGLGSETYDTGGGTVRSGGTASAADTLLNPYRIFA